MLVNFLWGGKWKGGDWHKKAGSNPAPPTTKQNTHMKHFITSIALLLAITTHAQVSINAGLSSRFSPILKVAIEKPTGWNNTELSTTVSLDNYHPVIGLQSGFTTQFEGEQSNYRVMVGAFLHTGLTDPKTDIRCPVLKWGASFRWLIVNTSFGADYNGETLNLTFGYLLNKRK